LNSSFDYTNQTVFESNLGRNVTIISSDEEEKNERKILASLPEKQKTTAALLQKPNIASFWRDSAK